MSLGITVFAAVSLLASNVAQAEPLYKGTEPVPADAIVLFDGKDLSAWTRRGLDETPQWKVENGYMEIAPGTGDAVTREEFMDFQLHIEFWLPKLPDAEGQGRSNSGVYLQGLYEVQLLDSYGIDKVSPGDCGGIYNVAPPMVNAARPPETWQTYDIFFRAPRFDEAGNKTASAVVSVLHNGIWIHHNQEIPHPTGGHLDHNHSKPGPIMLQDHGNVLRFRNIWIRPLPQ